MQEERKGKFQEESDEELAKWMGKEGSVRSDCPQSEGKRRLGWTRQRQEGEG